MAIYVIGDTLFYCVYVMIVHFWASAALSNKQVVVRATWKRFFQCCAAAYAALETVVVLMYLHFSFDVIIVVHSIGVAILGIIVAGSFFVMWGTLAATLRSIADSVRFH